MKMELPAWAGSLDQATLISAASEQVGSDDSGDNHFVEGLDQFLFSVGNEGHLSDMGRVAVSMDVVRMLVNRLLHRLDQVAHPDIADQYVSDPVVITGIPRTGTTKLQRVLASDERLQSIPLWKNLYPAPLPEALYRDWISGGPGAEAGDPRRAVAQQVAHALFEAFPGVMAGHPMAPDEPEEETLLLQMSFETRATALMYRVPSYLDWLDTRSARYQFEYLREILRYLQWQDGGRRDRPFLLKSPPHLGCADSLFDVFPDALMIRCHRDPVEAVPSLCKLMEEMRPSRGIASVDRHELGQHMLAFCAAEWERHLGKEEALPGDQIIDVTYAEIVSDLHAAVSRLYGRRGFDLPSDVVARMDAWERKMRPGRYGPWQYSLERFGLEVGEIDKAFSAYYDRFPDVIAARQRV